MTPPRLLALDGLRLLCCSAVVVAHARWGERAGRAAALGVDVFFVLSGFVITRLLLAEIAATGTISLGHFYERRARRILPVYYGCLLAGFGLSWLLGETFTRPMRGPTSPDPWGAAAYALLAGNLSRSPVTAPVEVLWSVCIEEQFYLLFPLLLRRARGPYPALWPSALGLVAAWGARLWLAWRGDADLFRHPLAHADGLLCGALLAQLAAARPALLSPRPRPQAALIEAIACGLAAAHLLFRPASLAPWSYWYSFLASALVGVALIAALALSSGPLASLLASRPSVALGRLTYGGYAVHMYAVIGAWGLAARLPLGEAEVAVRLLLSLVFTFALAWLVDRWVERPFRGAGGR